MLNKVEVRNAAGDLLTLLLDDVSDGFIIEDIGGLDPVKATLVSTSFATLDGAQYQSARREPRNILMKLGLEPDYITSSVRDLRKTLYPFFMPKSKVDLKFFDTDGLNVDIEGRVESFEAPLFSKEPEADVSILCFDPDFVDKTEMTLSGNTVSDGTQTLVSYEGTVETGVVFQMNVNRTLSSFTIFHTAPDSSVTIFEFSASLVAGDVVTISSIAGDKYMILLRSFNVTSLLYAMSPQSGWIELQPGSDNYIRVYATGAPVPYTVKYNNRYGGL